MFFRLRHGEPNKVRDAARPGYDKVCDAALADYNKVCDGARAGCAKVRDEEWAGYHKVYAAALADYNKVCDAGAARLPQVCAAARAEYDRGGGGGLRQGVRCGVVQRLGGGSWN